MRAAAESCEGNTRPVKARIRRSVAIAVTSLALAIAGSAVAPQSASASDWGGVIDPAGCSDAYTVKSTPIKDWRGREVGKLEIRWSWNCYVQWARITAYGSAYHLAATVKEMPHPSNQAGTDEYNTSQAWTRGIALVGGSSSKVCAYGDLYQGPGYSHAAATVCA